MNVTSVQPLIDFKLKLKYDDDVEGIVDLSRLAGKGVFSIWNETGAFEKVFIGDSGQISWSDEIELCPDSLYLKMTGKTPAELFTNLQSNQRELAHA